VGDDRRDLPGLRIEAADSAALEVKAVDHRHADTLEQLVHADPSLGGAACQVV
jgi:hypothetical protein